MMKLKYADTSFVRRSGLVVTISDCNCSVLLRYSPSPLVPHTMLVPESLLVPHTILVPQPLLELQTSDEFQIVPPLGTVTFPQTAVTDHSGDHRQLLSMGKTK